jgi:transcription-repair coupling factor (superfamily II helicase)
MAVSAASSLSLRALLYGAIDRLRLDAVSGVVSGLTRPARALAVSAVAAKASVLVVVPADRDIDGVVENVRFFLGALLGWSAAQAESGVVACPSHEVDPYRALEPHLDVTSARARALHGLASGAARVVVASAPALTPRASSPSRLRAAAVEIRTGGDLDPVAFADRLAAAGFVRQDPVDQHGEFCARGGLVDVFPPGEPHPVRIEFLGDTIESIRRYDASSQRSIETLDGATILPLREVLPRMDGEPATTPDDAGEEDDGFDREASVLDFATGAGVRIVVFDAEDVEKLGAAHDAAIRSSFEEVVGGGRVVPPPDALIVRWEDVSAALARATRLEELELLGVEPLPAERRHVACQVAPKYHGRLPDWVADLRRAREAGETALFVAATSGRAERTLELLREYDIVALPIDAAESAKAASVLVTTGVLDEGFRLPDARLQIFAEPDVFDEDRVKRERGQAGRGGLGAKARFFSDFRDLKVGSHVVHVDHGIGMFVGLKKITVGADAQEFMELRYAGDDKLFVPVERLDLVQKYSGGARPTLDRLGGTTWEKAKTRVKKAMRDMADELLKLYAARRAMPGHAFAADTHWQEEFENAFEYELTPDQQTAIADIKRDMESTVPMDRLLCGDVGYGKTEVAMRAAFKAVMDGKQVAFLAPTTVLAFQHLKTLQTRFAAFPVRIDMVSRFRSPAEQKQTLAQLAEGKVDIIVGTHRLLSKDVKLHDIGLLVVDEEQRFGVAHKERLKQLRRKVDVLTMSATPIPRTLNMSLVGIRDMSIIETPPRDRLAIQTSVVAFDQRVIADAIRHELERHGQVYFVHNRVESIYSVANLLRRLVPEARLGIGHGQMGEGELEKVMVGFVAREFDVLVATTIIENGLDIPNANTMIVNRADRYGLAQLYQLRGRVGRSDRRAYAYLFVPPGNALSAVARKRLAAIREFSDLGSGFRVAALDLEIRGSGNLLGGEQSGHIEAIGFELYLQLLEDTIRELKGEELQDDSRASVNLKVDLRIDEAYVPDMNQRLGVYRRIAAVRSDEELEDTMVEVQDRYGPPPASVLNLGSYAAIRLLADRLRIDAIDREGASVVFRFRPGASLDPARVVNLVSKRPEIALHPPSSLRLDLKQPTISSTLTRMLPGRSQAGAAEVGRKTESMAGSWWTQRAKTGEVSAGFSKQNLTRAAAEDPRAGGGLFDRVLGLLRELSDLA